MKKYLKSVLEWKICCSLIYTVSILIFIIIKMILRKNDISIVELLSLLCMSIVVSILQYLFFSETRTHKMTYMKRLVLFALLFLPILGFIAYQFHWFPIEKISAWILFIVIYVIILVIMTLGFEIYFRISEKKYEGIIGQYKKEKDAS